MKMGNKVFHCMIFRTNISSDSFQFQIESCYALSLKNSLLNKAKIKKFIIYIIYIFGQFLDILLTKCQERRYISYKLSFRSYFFV